MPKIGEKFLGHCVDLPVQAGDRVRVKKGTKIRVTYHGVKIAGRNQVVRVDHVLNGSTDVAMWSRDGATEDRYIANPSIRWAGSGGYWHEVDINDVELV